MGISNLSIKNLYIILISTVLPLVMGDHLPYYKNKKHFGNFWECICQL